MSDVISKMFAKNPVSTDQNDVNWCMSARRSGQPLAQSGCGSGDG